MKKKGFWYQVNRAIEWVFCTAGNHDWILTEQGRFWDACGRREVWVPGTGPDGGSWEKTNDA